MTIHVDMSTMKQVLLLNIEKKIPTMMWGPAGVGKSSLPKEIAQELEIGFIDFRATQRDPVDLMGLPLLDIKQGTTRNLPPVMLPSVSRHGPRGILLLDELPQSHDMMQKACFSLVLDGFVGEYRLPDLWAVIAAGNRTTDRSGAARMNKALANRFLHYDVKTDVDGWRKWAEANDIDPLVVAFLLYRPQFLHMMPDGEENSFPTPRSWEMASNAIKGIKDEALRYVQVAAAVGTAVADEFEAFVRVWSRVPSIDEILRDPKAAIVPSMQEPSLLYATAYAIGKRVTKKSLGNAITYMKRLPKEFEIMSLVNAVRRNPDLKATKEFGTWFASNSEVII